LPAQRGVQLSPGVVSSVSVALLPPPLLACPLLAPVGFPLTVVVPTVHAVKTPKVARTRKDLVAR
jgi:hypothetical protein